MKRAFALTAILALSAATACAQSQSDLSGGAVEITRAEWVEVGGEARAVVYGHWVRGLSTPPNCSLLEGRDGEHSDWPAPGLNASSDGNSFSKEFAAGKDSRLDPTLDYYVRCSVNVATGRTLDTEARVGGEIPAQYLLTVESTSE